MRLAYIQEADTKRIEISDDDPWMIRRWVYHCYLESYPSYAWGTTDGEEETGCISELHTNISMYAIADKEDMADLKLEALQNSNDSSIRKTERRRAWTP